MTEDEREELIYRLLAEFEESVGHLEDSRKYAFIAGARAMAHELEK